MDKKHRQLLRENRVTLVKDLEPKQLLSYLYQEEIFSEEDGEIVKAEATRTSQAERLLEMLPRRGPKAFDVFCDALGRIQGQTHLVFLLKANITDSSGMNDSENES